MDVPAAIEAQPSSRRLLLAVGAVGVVFGDIGTSPLYTMREVFNGSHAVSPSTENVLGVLSLIFWALMIVVSLKYVVFIMRADNKGEGGIMALMALVQRATAKTPRARSALMLAGIFGAALFYGDGMITPAISVLSAVEGLQVAAPALESFVVPVALVILFALFLLQHKGTAKVGALFGPVMCVWFLILACLGGSHILRDPMVLEALSPLHAVRFFLQHQGHGFWVLGAVVLAITGAEAVYADMGHFGKGPIRLAWFWFVLPALLINYFGQGALLLHDVTAARNPFYLLVPGWALLPMVGLATAATIIASQAVISGAFSVTHQATQLGYLPRMDTRYTSETEKGQIYIPFLNWGLLVGIFVLVLGFRSSSDLAAAYGIAVTGTMVIDTILACVVVRVLWQWHPIAVALGASVFILIDLAFLGANALKLFHGGWFPVVIAGAVFTMMSTWDRGRQLVSARLRESDIPLLRFLDTLGTDTPRRVPGTAVFLTANRAGVPHALLHNLNHNKVLHERVVVLTVVTRDVPFVAAGERIEVQALLHNFYRVIVNYGFKDDPDIPKALRACKPRGLACDLMETSFFLSRETLIPTTLPGMALWREKLFVSMARNAGSATAYFGIPTNRVVELGTQIEF
ncbi:MAG: potassium transporter Kup [Gammaproteobacteria bacterium]